MRLSQTLPQRVCPGLHAGRQVPPTQSPPQYREHPPQFIRSEKVLTQTPEQVVIPEAHAQAPETQLCPAEQALPHAPQWVALVRVSTHAPPHEVCPGAQVPVQTPRRQTAPRAQTRPHMPQFAGSVWRS